MTKLMGILNTTPDSFFDQGKYQGFEKAIERAKEIYLEGADLIDIGGESTRPGSEPVSEEEEFCRVIPLIKFLRKEIPIPISIDTSKPSVAKAAIHAGATLVNDVKGFQNPLMRQVASAHDVDICVMHMQGAPSTMQLNPCYKEGILQHLLNWFEQQIELLVKEGVQEKRIILDPGIGFGKTVADNMTIIQNFTRFKTFGMRILFGVSRKSFMGKILNKHTTDLLPATIAVNTLLIQSGVDMIRVHDVREHRDVIDFYKASSSLI